MSDREKYILMIKIIFYRIKMMIIYGYNILKLRLIKIIGLMMMMMMMMMRILRNDNHHNRNHRLLMMMILIFNIHNYNDDDIYIQYS